MSTLLLTTFGLAYPLDVSLMPSLVWCPCVCPQVTHLASGAFSHVYSAKYRGHSVVVKLLREQYKESAVTLKQMRFEQVRHMIPL